jgi:hypothetical protein
MDMDTVTKDDIEDCSEGEEDAVTKSVSTSSLPPAPGVAGRFESYLGARQSEGNNRLDATPASPGEEAFDAEVTEPLNPLDPLLLEEVHVNDDGTITGGPAPDEAEEEEEEEPMSLNLANDRFTSDLLLQPPAAALAVELEPGDESDGSFDAEEPVDLGGSSMPGAADELPVPDEPWKDRPLAEREMWERVRPRTVRREAMRVRELKFPAATLNRLMRVHPEMQTKTSEALETVNCATVLLLQAVAQAVVRGRKAAGHTVRLEDIKQVCLNNRELNFMLPLSATLDASALNISRIDADDGSNAATRSAFNAPVAAAPGQSTLGSVGFARAAGPIAAQGSAFNDVEPINAGEDGLDFVTVHDNLHAKAKTPQAEKQGSKRKLQQSSKKAASKAPRTAAGAAEREKKAPEPNTNASLSSFFKRA